MLVYGFDNLEDQRIEREAVEFYHPATVIYRCATWRIGDALAWLPHANVLRERLSNFTIPLLSFINVLHGVLVMPLHGYLMLTEILGSPSCVTFYITKNLASRRKN